MMSTIWMRLLVTMLAVLALGMFAACGDDDDDSGGLSGPGGDDRSDQDNKDDNQGSGDDRDDGDDDDDRDDDDNDSPSGPGGGDEEEYVDTICTAFNEFAEDFSSVITNPDNQDVEDEDEALQLFREPYENLVNAIEDADPPDDITEFHEALVEALQDTLEAFESGDTSLLEALGEQDIPEPPADIAEKYEAIAADNENCQEAEFGFGEE